MEALWTQLSNASEIDCTDTSRRCCEALFQPFLLGGSVSCEAPPLQQLVENAITSCQSELQPILQVVCKHIARVAHNQKKQILVSGGTTMLPGFMDMFLNKIAPLQTHADVTVIQPESRELCAWRGGVKFACRPTFNEIFISRDEYHEVNPCFCVFSKGCRRFFRMAP